MAQFIAFDKNVEVNGETVLSVVNGVSEFYREKMYNILAQYDILEPKPGHWYKQANWLSAFKEISETIGMYTLFAIGKSIPKNAIFPPDILTLKDALESINVAYHLNHRNGEIGYYRLHDFDSGNRKALMECYNPYPCHFDRGIIASMTRMFSPLDTMQPDVLLDNSKPGRLNGSDTSWYLVTW